MTLYLLKLGELTLKGGNRVGFEKKLRDNLRLMLEGTGASVEPRVGRFFVRCPEGAEGPVEEALGRLIGISGWAKARRCAKTVPAVMEAAVQEATTLAAAGIRTFKVEARRSDKSFPLDSYGIMREAGSAITDALPGLAVDVHRPQRIVEVEIREQAFVYGEERPGRRGLPVGTSGKGLLLLSGGIDSPVAGYLMAKRGMRVDAVYFHAYPYTSKEAKDKVATLAAILARYALSVRLFTIPFTAVQLRIKERAPEQWTTVLMRMAMMELSSRLARLIGSACLVTGESLGQVASQTIENMACAQSRTILPVLRPLVGTDKLDTIAVAKDIGSYETSILPYEDCCVIFSPSHPVLKAELGEAKSLYEGLELGPLLDEALAKRESERFAYPGREVLIQGKPAAGA